MIFKQTRKPNNCWYHIFFSCARFFLVHLQFDCHCWVDRYCISKSYSNISLHYVYSYYLSTVFHVSLQKSNCTYEFTLCIRIYIMYMNSHYVYEFTLCIRIHIIYTNSHYAYEFTLCIRIHHMYMNSYTH